MSVPQERLSGGLHPGGASGVAHGYLRGLSFDEETSSPMPSAADWAFSSSTGYLGGGHVPMAIPTTPPPKIYVGESDPLSASADDDVLEEYRGKIAPADYDAI